jgi:hypothetical protein
MADNLHIKTLVFELRASGWLVALAVLFLSVGFTIGRYMQLWGVLAQYPDVGTPLTVRLGYFVRSPRPLRTLTFRQNNRISPSASQENARRELSRALAISRAL